MIVSVSVSVSVLVGGVMVNAVDYLWRPTGILGIDARYLDHSYFCKFGSIWCVFDRLLFICSLLRLLLFVFILAMVGLLFVVIIFVVHELFY